MKKQLFAVIGAALVALGSMASPLTPSEALNRLNSVDGPSRIKAQQYNVSPVYTEYTADRTTALYVFGKANGEGYAIISADDVAYPMLGYSDSGKFDADNMPESMKWWLGEYARQIEWAKSQNSAVNEELRLPSEWTAVGPLCATRWDQTKPYNNNCPSPKGSDDITVTGCVATSMAQVMKYFNYPVTGEGTISYRGSKVNKTLAMNFGKKDFDWSHMLDEYKAGSYTDEEAEAVSYLMKACGYSVKMDYGVDVSSAQGTVISGALRTYFKYDDGCTSEFRIVYSSSEWASKVYNNLKNIGPVIINGHSPQDGGHSFVCDGYDGKGYFHFNWGWGGMSDGYYALEALNPDALGTGGYTGGFNFGQNAVFGIRPKVEGSTGRAAQIIQYGNSVATLEGDVITMGAVDYSPAGWGNAGDFEATFYVGLKFVSENGDSTTADCNFGTLSNITLDPGYYYTYPKYSINATIPANLTDGTYTVTVVSKVEGGEYTPVLVPYGYNNKVKLTKKGSDYTVETIAPAVLKLDKVELGSNLYYNRKALYKLTIENNSDYELTQGFAPRLYKDNKLEQMGGGVLISVPAHKTVEREMIVALEKVTGASAVTADTDFELEFYNPQTNVSYGKYGIVTMGAITNQTALACNSLTIADTERAQFNFMGSVKDVDVVKDKSDMKVDVDFFVRYGYFDGQVILGIYKVSTKDGYSLAPVIDEFQKENYFMNGGDNALLSGTVDFSIGEPNVLYAVVANTTQGRKTDRMSFKYFVVNGTDLSGVEGVISDSEEVRYYDLQGCEISEPHRGQVVIKVTGAKAEKVRY